MASGTQEANLTGLRDQQQVLALLFGVVLIVLGVLDFIGVGATDGRLLGIFAISPIVNLVHVLTGLLGVILGRYAGGGALFNKLGGVIYLAVFAVGAVAVAAGLGGIDWATNGLHLLLGIVVAAIGFGVGESRPC